MGNVEHRPTAPTAQPNTHHTHITRTAPTGGRRQQAMSMTSGVPAAHANRNQHLRYISSNSTCLLPLHACYADLAEGYRTGMPTIQRPSLVSRWRHWIMCHEYGIGMIDDYHHVAWGVNGGVAQPHTAHCTLAHAARHIGHPIACHIVRFWILDFGILGFADLAIWC